MLPQLLCFVCLNLTHLYAHTHAGEGLPGTHLYVHLHPAAGKAMSTDPHVGKCRCLRAKGLTQSVLAAISSEGGSKPTTPVYGALGKLPNSPTV